MWQVKFIADLLADSSRHFLLSASMGALAYCWISIISYASIWVWERSTRSKMSTAAVYSTLGLCLLAGVGLALLSHAWLDGFSLWYVTPLGEPLHLITN
jgi:hypothetical protein